MSINKFKVLVDLFTSFGTVLIRGGGGKGGGRSVSINKYRYCFWFRITYFDTVLTRGGGC